MGLRINLECVETLWRFRGQKGIRHVVPEPDRIALPRMG
jgi:hypothetical protein